MTLRRSNTNKMTTVTQNVEVNDIDDYDDDDDGFPEQNYALN